MKNLLRPFSKTVGRTWPPWKKLWCDEIWGCWYNSKMKQKVFPKLKVLMPKTH